MSDKKPTLKYQIKSNAIAIISMIIAITSLSYNTWRNEMSEHNRNVRTSSFQILMALADLQLQVDHAYYSDGQFDNIKGWRNVLYIQDLSHTVNHDVEQAANTLHKVWSENWQQLTLAEDSNKSVNNAIEKTRQHVLDTLNRLN
ncbi:hypothetical protein [Thalassotalea maritima]|uniref:hypothetical protein n=1 Tax=Thalassotalea maritima TaxID=3242416 RepID=UPI0035271819